ncbi:adhesin HecA family 20-residue repeat-containing protein, partial [Pseudomonas sp. NFACC09-4]
QLRGYTEVAGKSAHVIVANPYGITCNGCGFINTPRATLTTGKPVVENGQLSRYQVDQGSVAIEGAGLNANNVDRFEIITRSARINAEIQAKNLTIVAGRNDVDAATLNATARADDGSDKPQLAIDSSALGGMYAGAIKLVGTEAGVGVKLDGKLIASGGDIQLDANGHLSLADTSASGAVNVKAASLDARGPVYAGTELTVKTQGDLTSQNNLVARDSIRLDSGGSLRNNGIIEAGVNSDNTRNTSGDVSFTAQSLNNNGKSIVASRNLTANVAQTLNNQGGTLSAGQTAAVKAGTLNNQNKGRVLSNGALNVTADKLLNTQGIVSSSGNLTANVGQLNNHDGEVSSAATLQLTGNTLDNSDGLLSGDVALNIGLIGALNNRKGVLGAGALLTVTAASLDNTLEGRLVSDGRLSTRIGGLFDNQQGRLDAKGVVDLQVARLDNRGGRMSSAVGVNITGQNLDNSDSGKILAGTDLSLNVAAIINQNKGLLFSTGSTAVTGQSLDNSGASLITRQALDIRLDNALTNVAGLISSDGSLTVNTGTFDNIQGGYLVSSDTLDLTATQVSNGIASRIASEKALAASVSGLDQRGGELFSNTSLILDLNHARLNNLKGVITAPVLVLKDLKDVDNRGGEISSAQAFTLTAQNLDNSNGKLISNQALTLRIDQVLNSVKGLISAQSIDSHSASLNNTDGLISSRGALVLTVDGQLLNRNAAVIADSDLYIEAANLDNSAGQIAGKINVTADVASFNNQSGQMIALGGLTLTGTSLDNRGAGLVGATDKLTLSVDSIDNRSGELSSQADVSLTGHALDNSDGGQVFANGALVVTVQDVLNRTRGLLSGKTGLALKGQTLDNNGGSMLSQKELTVDLSGDMDNTRGTLSAEGVLQINAAQLTNTLGNLSSAGVLVLTLDDALLNQGGAIVTDGGLTVKSASLDNRNNGNLSGKQAVIVETGAFDNSQSGRLTSDARIDLTTKKLTNQDGGRIASNGALTVSVTDLDQQGGQLFSNTAMTLDLNRGHLNNQNGLINAPLLVLKNLKGVDNDSGEISSAQAFTLAAQNLNNDNGKLLSNQTLTLRIDNALSNLKGLIAAAAVDAEAASLDNRGGILTSRANLDLKLSGALDNRHQGLINATDNLTITSNDLNNQQGSLLGSAIAIDFGADTGDLNNHAGLITTAGVLNLKHLRDLNNRGGEISSSQSLDLTARDLDNSAGKLISNGLLTVAARDVINQGGLMSGFKGLDLTATNLDNRNTGTLSSRDEDVNVILGGTLLNNNAGALVGQKKLTIIASSLDNRGGIFSSGADQTLTVTGGLLNNAQGGLINSGATLVMNAMTLGNTSGTINAQQALNFTGTSLDNSGGNLIGNAAVTLDLLGALTNTNGKIASVGPLRVERATQINNQGGQIASQSLLTLLTGGLDNRNRGTVAANDFLVLNTSGAVQNDADGLIYSQNGGVEIDAASLTNGKGVVQSQGGLKLTVDADIDNQSGRLQAKTGDVTVVGHNLDNRGGVLASLQGMLTTQLTGVLRNGYDLNNNRQGGITQAQRLNLIALGGLDNYGGRISAETGDASVTTRNFDNRNGGLYAKGKVNVSANDFDNSGDNDGQIAGSQIDLDLTGALNNRLGIIESESTLAIKAASLDNQTGQLRALGGSGTTNFQIGGLFDNRNGTLETANNGLILNAANFQNQGGSLLHVGSGNFDISTANLTNAGGNLVTRGGLTLTAKNWTNSSVIQAGRLTVNVDNLTQTGTGQLLASTSLEGSGENWSNDGLIASDGSISLVLGGSYGGNGRYSSLGNLALSAASMNLGSTGSVASGADATFKINGQLNNYGRMTAASALTVNASSINNFGTLGSGGNLRLGASSLLNQNGLIFSGADMALRVNDFTNRFADVYGTGNISISRDDSNAWSASIANISASIESGGDLTLAADRIENRKDVFEAVGGFVSGAIGVQCYSCSSFDGFQPHFPGYLVWVENYHSRIVQDSASASMAAGRNFTGNGRELLNNASSISAGNDLTLNLQSFTNQGAAVGDYTVRRSLSAPEDLFRWRQIMDYNAANDPAYDSGAAGYRDGDFISPNLHVWNSQGVESISRVGGRLGGGEAMRFFNFGGIWAEFDGGHYSFTPAHYSDGVRTDAPAFVKNGAFFENTITYDGPSNFASAVVQAGGAVHINATQNLTNSVVREGVTLNGGESKVGSTQLSGQVTPAVIQINGQLPPNLAQQQLNPLTLPGFSLPTGQNGLFRLSGQGGSVQQAGSQNWSMGSASISTAQRQQDLPGSQAGSVQIKETAQAIFDDRQLTPIDAHTVDNSNAPPVANTEHSFPFPSRPIGSTSIATITSQTLERVKGLPDASFKSNPQKYLIETNPALTELKSFMSSDYLLQNLGYDPDQSAKRLGDGFYEQKLIQEAVVARTGQRFIDGQTSNEGLFKYLMDNAVASKQELDLSVGVTLTSEQVAALTHDIVWLEEHEVNGEKVLVPVLYMAQVNNRLAPNGALIQGADVKLIAGQDLKNSGTLRASNNLDASAGNDIVNSGLIEAGERLDLLAGNNIVNKAGGVLAGRDVSLTTTSGDVINERSITATGDNKHLHLEYVDSAARIEAANDLSIKARRDFVSTGGVLDSGRDTTISAGRDVSIATVEQRSSSNLGKQSSSITQHGSTLDVGRDLAVSAGRDLSAVASQIDAKRDVSMSAAGDLTLASAADEQHVYSRSKRVTSQEDHVTQVSTALTAGGNVTLNAGKDLELIASRVSAGDEAYLYAGDNVNLETADNVDYSYYSKTKKGSFGKKKSTMTETEKVVSVSSSIEAGNKLAISAGQDFNATGAKLNSDGTLLATAGRDITFDAAENYASQASASSKKGWTSSKSSASKVTQTRLNSTELVAKNIELKADNDISLTAAALRAEETVKLTASNDVLIGAGEETQTTSQSKSSSKTGVNFSGLLTATRKTQQAQTTSTQNVGSDISGGSIQIKSSRDTVVEGSTLVADKNIGIDAGRNLEITSAENTETSSSKSGSKKVGEIGSWWQGATGILKQKEAAQYTSTRQSGSQIASLGGDINLIADDRYTQTASQLVTPEGDVGITAKHVDIEAGFDSLNSTRTASTSRTAVGGSVSIPLLNALKGIQQMGEAVQKTSDERMVALAAVNAAMNAKQALDAGQALMDAPNTGIRISVNLSDSRSHSESSQSGRNVVGSDVVAGGNVKVVAIGDGADSDINVIGSRIEGGGDVSLKADGEINLLSAQNTAHQESTNGNSGWSAGIGIGFGGAQNGVSFELAANVGRGMSDGDDVTQTNTYIKGGKSVKLESGKDTNIKGAVVSADQVKVKVGGDLNIESLQDTSTFTSKQMAANIGVNICVPPICAGMSTVSGGVFSQNMHSEYASVGEQSGIKAGDGGFQVEVLGNTDLKGAVIASTDKAVADGKNTLDTGTLTSSDIKNKAEYDATSINLSGGYGGAIGRDVDGNTSATSNANGPNVPGKDGVSVSTPVVLYAGDDSSSTTRSGISGAAVTITNAAKQQELTGQTAEQTVAAINSDVSSDRDGSNKLKPIFNAQEIGVDFEIVGKFVQNASEYIESRAREIDEKKKQANKEKAAAQDQSLSVEDRTAHHENYLKLNQQIKEIDEDWGAGGTYRQIATALVAGISGNVTGSSAQFAQSMVVNYVQQQGSAYIGELVKKGLKEGGPEHAALHAILGCAGAAASNQSCSAGALGGSAASLLAGLFDDADPNETAVEREAKRNLITSLVTGIATMSNPNGAATANNAATANVDNNWLATQQYVQAKKEIDAEPNPLKKLAIATKWQITSLKQDLLTGSGILKGFTDGMAGAGLGALDSAVTFMTDPMQSWEAVKEFASSEEARALLGDSVAAAFKSQIDQIGTAIVEGGDANAENLGKQMGQAVALVVQLMVGGGNGSAESALALSRMGIDVSVNTVKRIEASVDIDVIKTRINKLEELNPDSDVPDLDPPKPVTPPKITNSSDYVDLLSDESKKHILYGDGPGSGGHLWPGQPGKTVFPESWSAEKIIHEVSDILTSPDTKWYAQTGTGGLYTKNGDPAKWVSYETRDGVRMRVVYQPAVQNVITAFPDDAPIPPYKPIK